MPNTSDDLQSSSAHRSKGLLSPSRRTMQFRRILQELRYPEELWKVPTQEELDGMQDLCYRLYSAEVADMMAARLGVTRQAIREALDAGLTWIPT